MNKSWSDREHRRVCYAPLAFASGCVIKGMNQCPAGTPSGIRLHLSRRVRRQRFSAADFEDQLAAHMLGFAEFMSANRSG